MLAHAGGEGGPAALASRVGEVWETFLGVYFSAEKGMDFAESLVGVCSRARRHGRSRNGLGLRSSQGFHSCFPQLLREPVKQLGALLLWGIQG